MWNDTGTIYSQIIGLDATISYSGMIEPISAIQRFRNRWTLVIKHDFQSAVCHVSLSPLGTLLPASNRQNTYTVEECLPFVLNTVVYILIIGLDVFHSIHEAVLQRQELAAKNIHYRDDFIIIVLATAIMDIKNYTTGFSEPWQGLGHSIKEWKI